MPKFNLNEELKTIENTRFANFSYHIKEDCVYLSRIHSSMKGYGTRAMRCLIQLSMEKGFGGTLDLEACYSSHLFYLYMGMIPKDKKINYVSKMYGMCGEDSLSELKSCQNENDVQEKVEYINNLIGMLAH